MYMFCRDSKLLGWRKWGDNFALDPMGKCAERLLLRSAATDYTHIYTGKCAERLLLRSAATDYTHIYTEYSIQTGKCLGQKSAQKIV